MLGKIDVYLMHKYQSRALLRRTFLKYLYNARAALDVDMIHLLINYSMTLACCIECEINNETHFFSLFLFIHLQSIKCLSIVRRALIRK